MSNNVVYVNGKRQKRYGLFNFALDATLTVFTGGLWIIWIIVRESRG
jgi:hypothetical protein